MKYFIKCQVESGMFPNERVVSFWAENTKVSFFVNSLFLQDDILKIELLDQNQSHALIKIPGESSNGHIVKINKNLLLIQ